MSKKAVFTDPETGEVLAELDMDFVKWAYSREGRWKDGREFPNPTPLEPPLGYVKSVPLHEQIRAMVIRELSEAADANGMETEEEADDFDVGDDYDPSSPYEYNFEPTEPWPGTTPEPAETAADGPVSGVQGGNPPAASPPAAPPEAPPPASQK